MNASAGPARGQLRVYLGAAPGVGKTFAMLEEGRRRAERGTDVVVGFVETHGRPRTEQAVGGLEVVPRRTVSYRGLTLTEMDVDAVLARRPEVALVDELAHSAPDHTKRWCEVETLLEAGVDVITTVNIQHLESLNDVVASITGIRQAETVPDHVVRAADAVELVDMSPQSLRRRMAHGNIYPPAKVDAALAQYFREGNLAALRELALLWLADRVDEGLAGYRESHGISATWATRERVVVAVSGGPESVNLMRRAARIASRSAGGEWLAGYVSRNDGLQAIAPDRLEQLRTAARDLGGEFRAVVAEDPAEGLLDLARGVNATQVLVGASRRSRFSSVLRPGIGETVIAESGDIDVHVVTHPYARAGRGRRRTTVGTRRQVAGYLMAVLGTAALTGLLAVTPELHGLPTESLLMMALVIGTALVGGLWPAMLGAVLGSLALNFFLVPPTLTLSVADPEDFVALIVFLLTGTAVALVVDAAARSTEQARRARTEANALAVLAHSLLHVGDSPAAVLEQASSVFGMAGAAVLRTEPDGRTRVDASWGDCPTTPDQADASATIEPGAVLALRGRPLAAADQGLLTAYTAHLAVIADRRRAAAESRRATELAEGNRIRTALLAAVSHDLRSPLAVIKAASDSLRSDVAFTPEDETELLATIGESADRLDLLVGNLLDLSRLQSGAVNPLITELEIGSAVAAALDGLPEADRVEVALPADLPTAQADPGLLDRVLANLVENALRHAGPEAPITVSGSTFVDEQSRRWVSVRISDRGRGVPTKLKAAMFEPFQRLDDVPNGSGLGLGLAVARGLSDAMGGRLSAEDTPGGGLTMVVDLPA